MCIVEILKLKRYGYMGLTSAHPIDVQTSSLVITIILYMYIVQVLRYIAEKHNLCK